MKKIMILGFFILSVCVVNAQSKAAFLSTFESISDLRANGDDDEVAAANWFTDEFGGDFLSTKDVETTDLSQYNVIWLAIERPWGFTNFPIELCGNVQNAIAEFYKNGGNLLLTNYAVKYLADMGRCNNSFSELWEDGSNVPDDNLVAWGPISTFGRFFANHPTKQVIDRSDDRLFEGLISEVRVTTETWDLSETTYLIYPLIGAGQKEVHRVTWTMDCDLNAGIDGGIDNPDFLTLFEEAYNVEAVAAYEYALGYHRMSIARWWPQGEFQGKAITIMDTGYEWNQNSGENMYQSNIEWLTINALTELGGLPSGLDNTISAKPAFVIEKDRIVITDDRIQAADIFNLNGQMLNCLNNVGSIIDIAGLNQGLYLLRLTTKDGKKTTAKFIKW